MLLLVVDINVVSGINVILAINVVTIIEFLFVRVTAAGNETTLVQISGKVSLVQASWTIAYRADFVSIPATGVVLQVFKHPFDIFTARQINVNSIISQVD
jgi:hypothetical protein